MRLIRMLAFLRMEVERLQHQLPAPEERREENPARQWAERIAKRPFG